ncbi:MAG TPA: serine/threonine-protein kinase [Polyangiaceae bacterium]|nr:serine/threonine-protein kinase [Polyangiaceae bacterium]
MEGAGANPGELLAGKYRVDQVLGTGGMGVVVSALHVHLQNEVAIKLLRSDRIIPGHSAERLIREARAACKIRSEHVARVFDVGVLEDGSPYIVMERLRGSDLASWIEREGTLSVTAAVDTVLQACEALAEAHVLGIVHRDLKPANLFRTEHMDGSLCIKVLDFGISKITSLAEDARPPSSRRAPKVSRASAQEMTWDGTTVDVPMCMPKKSTLPMALGESLTGTGAQVGSLHYMAPEQVLSARDVDARADIWSLGMILYELLAGRPAFARESAEDVARAILEEAPLSLRVTRPDVPPALDSAIVRCLEKRRADRFFDVAALADAIAPFASRRGKRSLERILGVMHHETSRSTSLFRLSSWGGVAKRVVAMAPLLVGFGIVLATMQFAGSTAPQGDTHAPQMEAPVQPPSFATAAASAAQTHIASALPRPKTAPTASARRKPPSAAAAAPATPPSSTPSPSELDPGHFFDARK